MVRLTGILVAANVLAILVFLATFLLTSSWEIGLVFTTAALGIAGYGLRNQLRFGGAQENQGVGRKTESKETIRG